MPFSTYITWTPLTAITALLDIAILAFIIYKLMLLISGTRAVPLIRGVAVILAVFVFSGKRLFDLRAINWLLGSFQTAIIVALVLLFQPELRRALEQIGRGQIFAIARSSLAASDIVYIIDEITEAVVSCAKTKTGALVVLERDTGLSDYIETGVLLDSAVTREILLNIFVDGTPLHDGAVIIRGDRVAAAACFLPLTDNPYLSTSLGTRHRAGIGITEVSDAICLIVSEETGTISLASDGKLVRALDEKQLRERLAVILSSAGQAKLFKGREVGKRA
ncbi:MAG: diadenylate cyclase CdaA [Clostridiales bacterium]|nr:diadenylate cyclase CdaA [Clostridiales bacterium]